MYTYDAIKDWPIERLNSDKNWTYMQYTGLKDKNGTGTEVYEGDLVQWRDDKQGEVVWQHDLCGFGIAFGDDWPLGSLSSWFEVIGNIWENGELLK